MPRGPKGEKRLADVIGRRHHGRPGSFGRPGSSLERQGSEIGIESMALSSRDDYVPWASGASPPRQRHLGRMALPNG
jgi:hypothetical protein